MRKTDAAGNWFPGRRGGTARIFLIPAAARGMARKAGFGCEDAKMADLAVLRERPLFAPCVAALGPLAADPRV